MQTFSPKSKATAFSLFTLKSTAFDTVNYRPAGSPANNTLSADTPKGVLAGMVAKMSASLEVDICTELTGNLPIGFFGGNSEGNAFENAPAVASGKVAVYMGYGSVYMLYVFETHAQTAAYAAKTLSTAYAVGTVLYSSPFGLVTNTASTDSAVCAVSCKVPSSTDLELGVIARV